MKKIFIIILHIGDITVTKSCLMSIEENEKNYAGIIIVNNDITELSGKDLPFKKLTIINNKKNFGFAGGVNVGIRYALKEKADAILLLNNDTMIVQPVLSILSKGVEKDTHIGILGPAICFEKNGKRVFDIGGEINMTTGRTQHQEVTKIENKELRDVTYITGAAMLIRKEVFEKVGFFDQQFFFYYEDADFCLRAKAKGFLVAVDPQVFIYHHLSKTIGKMTPFAIYHQTKSAVLFGRKYMKSPLQKIAHMGFLLIQTILISLKHPNTGIAGWRALLGI